MNSSFKKKSLESLASSYAFSWCGNTDTDNELLSSRFAEGPSPRHYGSYYFATVAPMPSRNLTRLKKIHATCLFVMRVSPKIEQKSIARLIFALY